MTDRIDELMKDLQNPQYWDLFIKGNARVLQLRQEWDRETCILIRDKIIESLKQNEKLNKVIDAIRELIDNYPYDLLPCQECGLDKKIKSILSEAEK